MSFIQVQQSLVTHRKTLRLARLLSLDRYAVIGRLVALWAWSLDNALDGDFGADFDPAVLADVLADVMGWDVSQGQPTEQVDALIAAGFLDEVTAEDGQSTPRLRLHDWQDWQNEQGWPDGRDDDAAPDEVRADGENALDENSEEV